jgi:hypothetical protein
MITTCIPVFSADVLLWRTTGKREIRLVVFSLCVNNQQVYGRKNAANTFRGGGGARRKKRRNMKKLSWQNIPATTSARCYSSSSRFRSSNRRADPIFWPTSQIERPGPAGFKGWAEDKELESNKITVCRVPERNRRTWRRSGAEKYFGLANLQGKDNVCKTKQYNTIYSSKRHSSFDCCNNKTYCNLVRTNFYIRFK